MNDYSLGLVGGRALSGRLIFRSNVRVSHLVRRLLRGNVGHVDDLALRLGGRLEFGDAVVVGLNGGPGGGDLLTGGGIGPVGGGAVLGVVQLAQLHIGLLDGILFGHVGGLQLRNLRQTLGRGHNGLGQVGCSLLEIIDKVHGSTSLEIRYPVY